MVEAVPDHLVDQYGIVDVASSPVEGEKQTPKGSGNEIQLTDAIAALQKLENVEAYRMKGQTFDCGSKIVLHYAVEHPKLGEEFKQLIKELNL
ncbi:unnamed protein product [Oppiella nova]|uniref:UTP--glucose-1-phosphate uridylyltransferase n=1 Tax=Oppiella nova TaxID=334625 RepID=A0A7R9LEQ4_9ACAR|nr:unnamed protein product [Oppiella nova]CAG2162917.1 unnamed protein product [Oppiella nova]